MAGIVCFPLDAVSGAPLYTGEMLRNAHGALVTAPSNRPIGAVSGVIPGAPTATIVSATSTTWTVNPFQAILDLEASASAGPYFASVATTQTGSMSAASAYARIDLLSLTLSDPAEGDGTSVPSLVITYTVGSSSGLPPGTPPRSFAFAQISVPATGGGSPAASWVAPFTVASGGIMPVVTGYRPSNPVQGQYVDDATAGLLRWNGTTWVSPLAGVTASAGWTAIPYASGWGDDGAPFQTGQYRIDALGYVHLRGMVKATANQSAGTYMTTLPTGFRPAATEVFVISAANATTTVQVQIEAAGGLKVNNAFTSGQYLSLSGITFQIAGL